MVSDTSNGEVGIKLGHLSLREIERGVADRLQVQGDWSLLLWAVSRVLFSNTSGGISNGRGGLEKTNCFEILICVW